jgi:hypothetical protein
MAPNRNRLGPGSCPVRTWLRRDRSQTGLPATSNSAPVMWRWNWSRFCQTGGAPVWQPGSSEPEQVNRSQFKQTGAFPAWKIRLRSCRTEVAAEVRFERNRSRSNGAGPTCISHLYRPPCSICQKKPGASPMCVLVRSIKDSGGGQLVACLNITSYDERETHQ